MVYRVNQKTFVTVHMLLCTGCIKKNTTPLLKRREFNDHETCFVIKKS